MTTDHPGRQLALVIGGRVVHAPRIRVGIYGGAMQVTACSGLGVPRMYEMITD